MIERQFFRVSIRFFISVLKFHNFNIKFQISQLELHVGDFIYINNDAVHTTTDGWVEAISFASGKCGFVPLSYTERTSETHVWELEVSVPISQASPSDDIDTTDGMSYTNNPGK